MTLSYNRFKHYYGSAYAFIFVFLLLSSCGPPTDSARLSFKVNYPESLANEKLDGRVLVMLTTTGEQEPRFQINDGLNTGQVFGIDVEDWEKGQSVTIDASTFGYPMASLKELEVREYHLQVLFHKYETFNLSTGHTVKLPMDRGEGQQWNRAPGNYYSIPKKTQIDPSQSEEIALNFDQEIPPIETPKDTKYIKHIKMKSELLSKFWGRPIYLGAHVLIPEGFDEHPEARYPLSVFHGHFPGDFGGFRETPPDPDMKPDFSARFGVDGYNVTQQKESHDFYKKWTGPDFPRMLIIEIQHPTPYYDDSYAVNSASMGPYGDAITYELIPHIEKEFRGIGEGWARFLYGGSTGGWEALAAQVMYPDEYNGCFAACPDPIDFRAYTLVDIYKDKNAYYYDSPLRKVLRPGHRDYLGQVNTSLKDYNYRELALGTKGRSGQQWDIWQAVYSPMGDDGYPKPIWDKKSGDIDKSVAEYWKENYDLRHIMERDWSKLGPKLEGKINIYCGDMDNYYLNNAVYLMEEFLENTKEPYYDGDVDYGDRAEHCWNGDQENPNHISRLRYNSMYVPKIMKRIKASAPKGSDVKSWRY